MPRPFPQSTAELVVDSVEAVVVQNGTADIAYVSTFTDQPEDQAEDALNLAVDLGLLEEDGGGYKPSSPLAHYVVSPDVSHKAAVIRVMLDSYEPFLRFRERLMATNSPRAAAEQTRVLLELDAHRAEIQETLISLGGYAQVLTAEGGGRYQLTEESAQNPLSVLAEACQDRNDAEAVIREQVGQDVIDLASQQEVLRPLSEALWRARSGDADGAVQQAGNAVESFLDEVGNRQGVNLVGAHGINATMNQLRDNWNLPRKIVNSARYLGDIRNAADHGVDPEIGASWTIREHTGLEYVFVACSLIHAVANRELDADHVL
jgi:hypothetical protein